MSLFLMLPKWCFDPDPPTLWHDVTKYEVFFFTASLTYYLWTGADTKINLATPSHSTDATITFNHEGMHRTNTYGLFLTFYFTCMN